MSISDKIRHFFHVVSNIRPIVWIGLYVALMPIFAVIYNLLPAGQFRIPDGGGTDFGSWLYYSIVTLTTLGFGDYTPAHGLAQAITAIEVMLGLVTLGFFLNAVGSLKSEIDVTAEIEKQRMLHESQEKDKLMQSVPMIIHSLNTFLAYCWAVTTPVAKRGKDDASTFNPDFSIADMADLFKPSGLAFDRTNRPAVSGLLRSASRTGLCLDSLQNRIDLTLWPKVLEDSFTFVADFEMLSSADAAEVHLKELSAPDKAAALSKEIASLTEVPQAKEGTPMATVVQLHDFIKKNGPLARRLETELSKDF